MSFHNSKDAETAEKVLDIIRKNPKIDSKGISQLIAWNLLRHLNYLEHYTHKGRLFFLVGGRNLSRKVERSGWAEKRLRDGHPRRLFLLRQGKRW